MKILLDIDDTLINHKDELHPRYKEVIENNEVILYSSSGDIKMWAKKLNLKYHHKDDKQEPPEADVLIDDCAAFKEVVKVQYYFSSIDSFLIFINRAVTRNGIGLPS